MFRHKRMNDESHDYTLTLASWDDFDRAAIVCDILAIQLPTIFDIPY